MHQRMGPAAPTPWKETMTQKSAIEWTDMTWNPVTGCTKVSPGCDHCYAERETNRWKRQVFTDVVLHPERLEDPVRVRKPSVVFVCSMSDLFHERIPLDYVEQVFDAMLRAPQHTFQVLTKRPGRMAYFAKMIGGWPRNVWAGTSVESARYLPRLDVLARVPARVRFVSAEPLLGPLDLLRWLPGWASAGSIHESPKHTERYDLDHSPVYPVDWVIVGGESGPQARPMHPDWARGIRDQCEAARVPFFFKQWGGRSPKRAGASLDGREWREVPAWT